MLEQNSAVDLNPNFAASCERVALQCRLRIAAVLGERHAALTEDGVLFSSLLAVTTSRGTAAR